MVIYNFNDSENAFSDINYLIASKQFEYNEFETKTISATKVRKSSFAELYLIKILKSLFKNTIDLKEEYNQYYSEEYDTWADYLYNKELLDNDEIKLLFSNLDDKKTIYKFDIAMLSYTVESLLQHDEHILEKINQMIKDFE